MAAVDRSRRAVLAGLKLVLPLLALGLLSTLFLVSERIDPSRALPFARVDVEDLARDPRVEAPRFAGVTADGGALIVTAQSVRSDARDDSARLFAARDLIAVLTTPDGGVNEMQADTGVIDRRSETLDLSGAVRLQAAAGYEVISDHLHARLDRTYLASPGPVIATGPGVSIAAGGMRLLHRPDAQTDGSYELVFTQGVRLLYDPRNEE